MKTTCWATFAVFTQLNTSWMFLIRSGVTAHANFIESRYFGRAPSSYEDIAQGVQGLSSIKISELFLTEKNKWVTGQNYAQDFTRHCHRTGKRKLCKWRVTNPQQKRSFESLNVNEQIIPFPPGVKLLTPFADLWCWLQACTPLLCSRRKMAWWFASFVWRSY